MANAFLGAVTKAAAALKKKSLLTILRTVAFVASFSLSECL